MGFKGIISNQICVDTIIDDIVEKILLCCDKMKDELFNSNTTMGNEETKIRDCLLYDYLQKNHIRKQFAITEYLFQPEVQERTSVQKMGRVDIKILINKISFENTDVYFIIECKRIDGTPKLNTKYISDGVCRFVSQNSYYSTYHNRNLMFGFVVNNIDIESNVKKINTIQSRIPEINIHQEFKRKMNSYYVYGSKYNHSSGIVELIHMFYDFSPVIS